MRSREIILRGVEVHNLRSIDLDLPHRKLIVVCGVSGSGKTSLALDTLYAEGQRRYIESFSAYTRQFLEQLDKPQAEQIEGIPPAIAITPRGRSSSGRATVATTTEIYDYLRLLFAKVGRIACHSCGQPVESFSPQSAAAAVAGMQASRKMVAFEAVSGEGEDREQIIARLRTEGFVRIVSDGRTFDLGEEAALPEKRTGPVYAIVDRLSGSSDMTRVRESIESAFAHGDGVCHVFAQAENEESGDIEIDGRPWHHTIYSRRLRCEACGIDYAEPSPQLFSFNNPLGACSECEGYGRVADLDWDLIVPNREKSIREGAIAPWRTKAYAHERDELIALAGDYGIDVDTPFKDLDERQIQLIWDGVPERDFGGLSGFFAWLEKRKYKMHIRVFLSRWRSYSPCPACGGARLRPEALAVKLRIDSRITSPSPLAPMGRGQGEGEEKQEVILESSLSGKSIAEIVEMPVRESRQLFDTLELEPSQQEVARLLLAQIAARIGYLEEIGLGYLALSRPLRTLSGGESQRVAMTAALGSSLVNLLYVLDEPTVGLHPHDVRPLLAVIEKLKDRGNTLVVVDHDESLIRGADHLVELGPGAGERGGRVVYHGSPDGIIDCERSTTGDFFAGRRGIRYSEQRREPGRGKIRIKGARGNNLADLTVEFPLGLLCLVTGVSGSGKSTLVVDTLYPALCRRLRKSAPKPLPFDDVFGDGQIEDVVMIDQSPLARSGRSNPVTYLKAFDAIREVFAETQDARMRNFTASHFSFNVEGGRCNVCKGEGTLEVDMQFMPEVRMTCGQCRGRRYRKEILDVKYRQRSIADVLDMTVREAFGFFRGHRKVQARLKPLIDVGLDYVRLGQPASTLSGGEAQRLKLAGHLASAKKARTLFLLDEPTTGLHFADVVQLLDCFDSLIDVGHSFVVVEHSLQMMKAADYIIDLGPGPAEEGGRVVVTGTPEEITECEASITGRYLREALQADAEALAVMAEQAEE